MQKKWAIGNIISYLLLTAGAVIMSIPFLYMVSTAFKKQTYVFEIPPRFIPSDPTFQNFTDAWNSNHFSLYFLNSLFVSVATTVIVVLVSSMLAFAFARFDFWGKKILFGIMLATLMIPGMMLILPQFVLAKSLGLLNSLWGLVFVYVAMNIAVNTFLLRGFFEGIPRELEEATRMDGGGFFTIFFRIVLPLSKPALATVAIFTFLFGWDEFVWAVTANNEPLKRTLPVAVATFHGAHQTQWGLVFAGSLFAILPVVIAFILLQKQFIRGLTSGAIKG